MGRRGRRERLRMGMGMRLWSERWGLTEVGLRRSPQRATAEPPPQHPWAVEASAVRLSPSAPAEEPWLAWLWAEYRAWKVEPQRPPQQAAAAAEPRPPHPWVEEAVRLGPPAPAEEPRLAWLWAE